MKSRNELAEAILLQLLTLAPSCDGPEIVVAEAFAFADAFLAAAGEQQRQEREPDAVWQLDLMPFGLNLSYGNGTGAQILPNDMANTHAVLAALIAGRERVRLRVYVEEVES